MGGHDELDFYHEQLGGFDQQNSHLLEATLKFADARDVRPSGNGPGKNSYIESNQPWSQSSQPSSPAETSMSETFPADAALDRIRIYIKRNRLHHRFPILDLHTLARIFRI